MDIYCDFGGDCCNARGFRTENAAEAESFWSAGQSSECVCEHWFIYIHEFEFYGCPYFHFKVASFQ